MGKNRAIKKTGHKANNPIYKKVTSKAKPKNKTKPVKTNIAKNKINNRKAREQLDCKWKDMRGGSKATTASTSAKQAPVPTPPATK